MGHPEDNETQPARAAFIRELRKVLSNLYNPGIIRNSPLIRLFGLERRRDGQAALQQILNRAIEALEPGAETPVGSSAWRFYQVLHGRFIDQFSQEEVARDLFLSPRQLRRLEQNAVEVLADHLWIAHNLEQRSELLGEPPALAGETTAGSAESGPSGPEEELAWLERTVTSEVVDCADLVRSALHTARPLLDSLRARVELSGLDTPLPPLAIQATSVRQALLHVVTLAAGRAGGGQVSIRAELLPNRLHVRLCITARPQHRLDLLRVDNQPTYPDGLGVAQKLIQLSKGTFDTRVAAGSTQSFEVAITLPTAEQVQVLVVDDNVDTLQLIERFLAGTRYRFIGAAHPAEALEIAERVAPSVIVLDVMLPDMDGWDLLGRLRAHPVTQNTPLVVCTILPQSQLALMLGAAEFLNKPIRRETLLATLDRLVGPALPGSA